MMNGSFDGFLFPNYYFFFTLHSYENLRADYNKYVKEKEEDTKQILNRYLQ